jgi:hypothetical protein
MVSFRSVCEFIIGLFSNSFTHIFSVGIKQKLDEKNPDGTPVFQFKHDDWKELVTSMDDKMLTTYYERHQAFPIFGIVWIGRCVL